MDYSRIYREFIADRLNKQPEKPTYFERHHIVPRSLGGGNEPENIIRLTPEDHFFAHLLLAKIHGGLMWAPIAFMVGGNKKFFRPRASRLKYGWAHRAMATSHSGKGAHQFDFTVYEVVNREGKEWSGYQSEMPLALGMTKINANMLVKSRVKSAKGWWLKGNSDPSTAGKNHHMYKDEVYDFVHVDGREFKGTQYEFTEATGVRRPDANRLVRGVYNLSQGWFLRGAEMPKNGRARAWLKKTNEQTV